MSNQTQIVSTFPVAGVLGVAFVILKLTGYIAWPWIWVLAPFWAPWALFLGFLAGVALCWLLALIVTTLALFFRKKR